MSMDGWIYGHMCVSEAIQFSLYSHDHVKGDGVRTPVNFSANVDDISDIEEYKIGGGGGSREVCQVGDGYS